MSSHDFWCGLNSFSTFKVIKRLLSSYGDKHSSW